MKNRKSVGTIYSPGVEVRDELDIDKWDFKGEVCVFESEEEEMVLMCVLEGEVLPETKFDEGLGWVLELERVDELVELKIGVDVGVEETLVDAVIEDEVREEVEDAVVEEEEVV
jgi:hypothetical protein